MINLLNAQQTVSSSPYGYGYVTPTSLAEMIRRHAGETFRRVSVTGCELSGAQLFSAEDIVSDVVPATSGRFVSASARRVYVRKDGALVVTYRRQYSGSITHVFVPVTPDVTAEAVKAETAVISALLESGAGLSASETERVVSNVRTALALGSSETFEERRLSARYVVGGVVESFILSADQTSSADVERAVLWVRELAPYLLRGETFGIWHPGDGSVFLDVVSAVDSLATAQIIAGERGELAIWDRANLAEIPVRTDLAWR